jgi:hypothetical protein
VPERLAETLGGQRSRAHRWPSEPGRLMLRSLAREWAVAKSSLRRVVRTLKITPLRQLDPAVGNKPVMTVTPQEAARLKQYLEGPWQARRKRPVCRETPGWMDEVGWFYMVRLEPLLEPNRVKLGFTTSLETRMRHHRCATPFVECVKAWLCRRSWERTVTHCVARDCERLHTEVYRARSVPAMVRRGDWFFGGMPGLRAEWRRRSRGGKRPEASEQ